MLTTEELNDFIEKVNMEWRTEDEPPGRTVMKKSWFWYLAERINELISKEGPHA